MKLYAVAHANFFDNDLQIRIVKANDWKEALSNAFDADKIKNVASCKDLKDAKWIAFNQDWLFDVVEITEENLSP